ncbi:MAG: NrfD/PsrC family molybdoenzyme membrane anchor subunit [Myxococcales bacterium]|nr:NrfD/PsrC family molybdoenzyme membrane anchor subunit [Myxococcales bacterium]
MSQPGAPIEAIGERRLVAEGTTFHDVTELVSRVTETKAPRGWWVLFLISLMLTGAMAAALAYLLTFGVGVWGSNSPVAWAWDITNFVWWIGIGHAGTLISAILFLFRQKWRTSINRFAEAMTIFAVMCAGLFPAIHTGRPWFDYYMFPLPNQMAMWPNFKSPLIWDVFAVSTYLTISVVFWYVGLIPDLATLRDRARTRIRRIVYGAFALGWRGSNRHWRNYERAYLILAALSTPLVLSVHSVVSFDFATSVLPGWHTTIFPPYFVAGAVFSGFALVLTLMLIARAVFGMHQLVTIKHLELMNKFMLATGLLVGYAYAMEFFIAWYSGNPYEWHVFRYNRLAGGPYWWAYWAMVLCNVVAPQLFWFKRFRTSVPVMFVISIVINIGMWFERFVIIATSLSRDFLPSAWGYFSPTWADITLYAGTIGFFMTLFLLFIRWVPMIAMAEVKATLPEADPHHAPHAEGHGEHGAAADRGTASGQPLPAAAE